MAKNEAKIKFTAETAEFNDAIKKSNSEMSKLRAEFKLNEAEMKNNGASVESLEKKHDLLEQQLSAAKDKTEALSGKVEAATRIFGENSDEVTKLKTQLANAQTAEEKIRGAINDCNAELQRQADAADETENATENLTDKIERQQTELKQLKTDYVNAVAEFGEASDEAKDLESQIENLSGELKQSKDAFDDAASKADKLDQSMNDAGDAARDSGDGFTVAKGAIADLASEAIQLGIEKISEFIGWLAELPEATRELRQDMSTLETSFETAGFTTEQATNTWKELYSVFGEDDRAVEAANLIAKMADNQQNLSDWVTITQGVWGQYQDSLPVEGLAEASMETAKTGTVTGVLADALNWSSEAAAMFAEYMGGDVVTAEDAFNVALSECSTEQERQALITETLTALYGDAATKYEEASGQQIAAKEATAENTLAQAELADAIEPVTTAWEGLKTSLITAVIPAVEAVSGVFVDALGWMKEHPVAMQAIAAAVGVLAIGFTGLAIAMGVYAAAQWAANLALAPFALPVLAIVAAVAALAAIVVVVINYWDEIKAAISNACSACITALQNAWAWVQETFATVCTWIDTNVIQAVGEFFVNLWTGISDGAASAVEWIKSTWSAITTWIDTNIIQPVGEFFVNLWSGISDGAASAVEWIKSTWSAITTWIDTNIIQPVVNFFTGLWETVVNVWNTICNAIQVAIMFIGSILSAAFQIIAIPFMFIWENCKQYVFAAWEWIKNAVSTAINAVKTVITTVMNRIKTVFTTAWNAIKNVVTTVWNAIVAFITPIVNSIKTAITTAWNAIKSTATTVWNAIKSVITTVWNGIKSGVTSAVNAVKTTVTNVWNAIKSTATTVWNAIKSVITTVWNGIKSGVTSAVNAVKTTVTNVWNAIKTTATNIWNGIKTTISSVWNGIKSGVTTAVNSVKSTVTNVWNAIKTTATNIWNGIKTTISSVWNGIKSGVTTAVNSVKSKVSSVFNGIKSTATSVWNSIKSAITTPIEAAKDKVKTAIDAIKGFFDNLDIKFPNIKLPHFSITGEFSLNPPSVPKLSIEWYKYGGVMLKPTMFGINGNRAMVGGEAGPEAIAPISTLQSYISESVERTMQAFNINALAAAVEDLANRPVELYVGDRQIALATASANDSVNGLRNTFKSRGLIVD